MFAVLLALLGDAAPGIDPSLLKRVIANEQATLKRLEEYCFRQSYLHERLNNDDKVTRRDERIEWVCHRDGVPVYKHKENDPWPEIRDDKDWQKHVRRAREKRERFAAIIAEAPRAFDFIAETPDGATSVYRMEPRPGYRPHSTATELLKHVHARVWIDPEAAQVVRLTAKVVNDFDMWGGIVLKVRKGATFEIRQRPVNGAWLPVFSDERWSARIGLLKNQAQHQRIERTEFAHCGLRIADCGLKAAGR